MQEVLKKFFSKKRNAASRERLAAQVDLFETEWVTGGFAAPEGRPRVTGIAAESLHSAYSFGGVQSPSPPRSISPPSPPVSPVPADVDGSGLFDGCGS